MKLRLIKSSVFLPVLLYCCIQNASSATQQLTRPNEPGPWPSVQVNTYTGNLFHQRNDLIITTRGEIPLDIYFSYNSLKHQHDKGYGFGWSFSFGMYYKPVGNNIVIFREDGQEDVFTWDGINYDPPVGVYDELTEYDAGKFLLRTKHGIKYYFDDNSHKHLTSIVDRNNNTITLSYSGGRPTTITDPSGRMLNLAWVGDHLSQITDPNTSPSRVIAFQYDGSWNLVQVARPLNNTYQYEYNTSGNMVTVTDPRYNTVTITYDLNEAVEGISCSSAYFYKYFTYNNCNNTTTVSQVVSAVNRQTIYTFDLAGRVTGIQYPGIGAVGFAWNSQNNLTTFVNENGSQANFTYDAKGNLLTATDCRNNSEIFAYEAIYNLKTSYRDKNGNFTYYAYDALGNLTTITDCYNKTRAFTYNSYGNILTAKDKNDQTTVYTYDIYGNRTVITDPLIQSETRTYDLVGNVLTVVDKRGYTTTFQYDLLGRNTVITDAMGYTLGFGYDANNNLISETNKNNQTISYAYDAANRLISITDAYGGTITRTLDEAGNLIIETNPRGFNTTYTYNDRDWLTAKTDCQNETETYTYDAAGLMLTSTDKMGNTRTYTRDCLGQIIQLDDANGNPEYFSYDAAGQRILHKNRNGNQTSSIFDCLGRLSVTNFPMGYSESYAYDNERNLTGFTNKNGNTITYGLDALGRILSTTDPLGKTESKTYDGQNNVTSSTDKNGNITTYTYDPIGRLILKTDPLPFGYTESFTWDGAGNMLNSTDRRGNVTSFQYDFLNRLTQMTTPMGLTETKSYDANGNVTASMNKNGFTTTYTYDCRDQLTITTDPLNVSETNIYNANGQRTGYINKNGKTTSWTYSCCRLESETDPLLLTEYYGYDNVGNRTSVTTRNGTVNNYYYDDLDRMYKTITPSNKTTLWGLDGMGNTVWKTDANQNTTDYTYNARDELTETSYPDASTITYSYNNNGDLLETVNTGGAGETITYTYDALGRVTIKETDFGAFSKSIIYTYDENGNQLTVTSETGTITNFYDLDNRLFKTVDQNGKETTFQYDGMGNQTVVNYPNGVSTYTSYDANGNVISVVTQTTPPPPLSKPVQVPEKKKVVLPLGPLTGIDYAVVEIISPLTGPGLGEYEPVTITIMNFGMTVLPGFEVNFTCGETIATEFLTVPIPPNGQGFYVHTFSQTVDLSEPGMTYELTACVNAPGDEDPTNNCMTTFITNIILITSYQSFSYGYDPEGNMISEQYQDGTNVSLTYNDRGDLVSEFNTATLETNEYTYTPNGQRATMTVATPFGSETDLYIYSPDGSLLSAGGVSFTPDDNGNRLTMTTAGGDVTEYTYSYDNELIQVDFPDGTTVQYDYSALGDPVRKTEDGIISYSHYTGGQLLNEFDASGSPTYYYNPDISIMIETMFLPLSGANGTPASSRDLDRSMMNGPMKAYYYYDGRGSTTLQLDTSGQVMASTLYDAFGNVTNSSGSWQNNQRAYSDQAYNTKLSMYSSKSSNLTGNSIYDPAKDNPLNASLLRGFNDPLLWKWYTIWLKMNKGMIKGGMIAAPGGGRPHGGRPGAGWLGPAGKWPVGGGAAAILGWRRGIGAAAMFGAWGLPAPGVAFIGGIPVLVPPRVAPVFPAPVGFPVAGLPGVFRWPGIAGPGGGILGGMQGIILNVDFIQHPAPPPQPPPPPPPPPPPAAPPPQLPSQRPSGGGGQGTGGQNTGATICGGSGGGLGGVGVISSGRFRTPANFTVRQGMIMDCSRISWSIMKMPNGSYSLQITGQNGAIPRDRSNVNNTPPYMSVRVEVAWNGFWAINNTNSQGAFSGTRDINCRDPFFMNLQYFSPWGGSPMYWGPCVVP